METPLNPQEYEDPNVTIHTILDALRTLIETVDFPITRLKQGFGPEVVEVLNVFANHALKEYYQPTRETVIVKGVTENEDEEEVTDPNEDTELEINFEEQFILIDEDIAENDFPLVSESLQNTDELRKPKGILISQTDSSKWKLEVERVLPQLKVVIRTNDHKVDWRIHVNEMQSHRKDIATHFSETSASLDKLIKEINKTLDKVSGREKYLQLQLEPLINEYNNLRSHLNQICENYKLVSGGVTGKSRELANICDEQEGIKNEMEEKNNSVTDGSPLVSLRKALQRIKSEITSIDIRVGVASHTVLQARIQENHEEIIERQIQTHAKSLHSFY